MENKKIKINTEVLRVFKENEGYLEVVSDNGSGLYTCEGESGTTYLTRTELKRIGNINDIDEAIEMLRNKEAGRIYTDDGLNFFTEKEFNELSEEDKAECYKVQFGKYIVQDRETGNNLEECETLDEAKAVIDKYEAEDKTNGTYEEDYYSIYDEDRDEWMNYGN